MNVILTPELQSPKECQMTKHLLLGPGGTEVLVLVGLNISAMHVLVGLNISASHIKSTINVGNCRSLH